uniref:Ankyrin repeat domain-containing protein SOWAHC n=2 Tax=Culex pipiens TaxID=7175 RepID=A0A8D8ASS8_CULPI
MDSGPRELSLAEIRNFMLKNNCKVTNHALVKHFRSFLTNKETQEEARKLFKSYVNLLASIKNEGDEKYLILRKKYIDECPSEDVLSAGYPMSPGSRSLVAVPSDSEGSPLKLPPPPPYRPPPEVSDLANPYAYHAGSPRGSVVTLSRKNSSDGRSGSEFSFGSTEVMSVDSRKIGSVLVRSESSDSRKFTEVSRKPSVELYRFDSQEEPVPAIPPRKRAVPEQPAKSSPVTELEPDSNKENVVVAEECDTKNANEASAAEQHEENKLSVKEKMLKFNRFASEEEAKVPSPIGKKKPEKNAEDTICSENLLQHPKAKEWLIAAANANYQELAKLSTDHPNLVKLQDMSTGYTALHWAAKHGNEDVVKLVAGTLKADVNARTNGGYTALHIAMQFGRNDIFELLCNVYKADRDLLDWSGKKALEYQKQMTSVSASTYSKIQALRLQVLSSGSSTWSIGAWRNQSQEKAYRKRLGIPEDWLSQRSGEENDRSLQQLFGSWNEHDANSTDPEN